MKGTSKIFTNLLLLLPLFAVAEMPERLSWQEPLLPLTVGVLVDDSENLSSRAMLAGVLDAGEKLGLPNDLYIEVITGKEAESARGNNAIIDALLLEEITGLIIQPGDNPPNAQRLSWLSELDIPFIQVFDDDALMGSLARVTYDEYAAGLLAFEAMASRLSPRDKTILVLHSPQLPERLKAFRDALKRSEKQLTLRLVESSEDYATVHEKLSDAVNADVSGDLDAIVMLGDWAMAGMDSLPWEPGKYKAVAIGALPTALARLLQGQVDVLIDQQPYKVGWEAMDRYVEFVKKKDRHRHGSLSERILIAPKIVSKDGAKKLLVQWNKWSQ